MPVRHAFVGGLAALLISAPVLAHPGHGMEDIGFSSGFMHPLLGVDHLLAMLVVGVWAAQHGKLARSVIPLSFMVLMSVGVVISRSGIVITHVEAGILASLLVVGALVASLQRFPLPAAMACVGTFAVFHGMAHGSEMGSHAAVLPYVVGMLLATALLHGTGLMLGSLSRAPWIGRASGAASIAAGLTLAFS